MKGVSAVIATVLMLLITIALAGTAYLYITGVFTARTGVVLTIDGTSSTCTSGGNITVFVRNDGTTAGSGLAISFTNPSGTTFVPQCQNPTPENLMSLPAGTTVSVSCNRVGQISAGSFGIIATSGSSTTTGTIYCSG